MAGIWCGGRAGKLGQVRTYQFRDREHEGKTRVCDTPRSLSAQDCTVNIRRYMFRNVWYTWEGMEWQQIIRNSINR